MESALEIVKIGGAPAALVIIFLVFIWKLAKEAKDMHTSSLKTMSTMMKEDREAHRDEDRENKVIYRQSIETVSGAHRESMKELTETLKIHTTDVTSELRAVKEKLP